MSASSVVARKTVQEEKLRNICALCVLTHVLGYDANTNKNKEAVHYLNQGAISLVLKLKAHLISRVIQKTKEKSKKR